jgi:glycosyltransferase involved in cell wall biosynthesis
VKLGYLFSRYPIVSQTFCDTEMLALESSGRALKIYSIYPPPTSFRHGHSARLRAGIEYAPPAPVLKRLAMKAKVDGRWPSKLVREHEERYGPDFKAELRARNALYFAEAFKRDGITHFHVHFANRAAHTALFIKAISGIPFSITAHGQDFMIDLGNDDLLREICRESEFIGAETEFSKSLLADLCPDSAGKLVRIYNGMDLSNFPKIDGTKPNAVPLIIGVGRLIEFKGFHHLIEACRILRDTGVNFRCEIVGEGPWRAALEQQIDASNLRDHVMLPGSLPQEEVFSKLSACDIFTLPCIIDANGASDVFPTVLLEAMASSRAVISTRLAGVPEMIENEKSGLLVEPGNASELAAALEKLIGSPDLRRDLGDAARDRIEEKFRVETTFVPLRDLFDRHVGNDNGVRPNATAPFACLVSEWPQSPEAEGQLLPAVKSQTRIFVFRAGEPSKTARPNLDLLGALIFLPDAMVLEGEWQQERHFARRIETLRSELGQKISTEFFLQHARYALYLRRICEREKLPQLHALDSGALLCAWILHRLAGIKMSADLNGPQLLADATVAQLSRELVARPAFIDPKR